MTIVSFVEELKKIGIELSNKQLEQFEKYYQFLIAENNKINLTTITSKEEVYEKHFYDSLLVTKVYDFSNQKICDVGAGAGFPSIPLKIVYPDLKLTIVDSLQKRINFLNKLASKLELNNFTAVAMRAEDYAKENRDCYDLVLARAVARLNILAELCLPLVKVKGYFIALKGRQGEEEKLEAKKGIQLLGAKLISSNKYLLLSAESVRYLLKYQKIQKTDYKYPRHYSQIKKRPL